MAHLVESMTYYGDVPWHGLGTKLPDEGRYDVATAIQAAGLDWTVGLRPRMISDGTPVSDHFAVQRSDGKVLGVVGDKYQPVQNADAFAWFQPFLDTKEVTLETAGSLQNSRLWILAKVNGPDRIAGDDVVNRYLLLAHSHDGSLSIRAGLTPIRVVCNNTLSMAVPGAGLHKVKHTLRASNRLEDVRTAIAEANEAFAQTAEQLRFLASINAKVADILAYAKRITGAEDESASTRAKNQAAKILEFAETGRGSALPGVRGTWWGAYNAVTEYLSHEAGHNSASRLNSLWFGVNRERNAQALKMAVEYARAA